MILISIQHETGKILEGNYWKAQVPAYNLLNSCQPAATYTSCKVFVEICSVFNVL